MRGGGGGAREARGLRTFGESPPPHPGGSCGGCAGRETLNAQDAGEGRGELGVGGASPVLLGSHSEKDARESSRLEFACVFARARSRGVSSGAGVRGSKRGNGGGTRKSQTQGPRGNLRLTSAEGRADPRQGCGAPEAGWTDDSVEDPPSRLGAPDPAGRELRLVLLSALCEVCRRA